MSKEKIYQYNISKHINGPFREYALYTLEHRGIPNFYDGLTNVQRLILIEAPSKFTKTLGVSGSVVATGNYHHGDSSLTGAITKLAKNFGCAERILDGDGFFGSPVKHEPAAPRYTQVKLNPIINDVLKKNWSLNAVNNEGVHERLEVEFPIGLLTHTIGIAVGYATNILPRKFSDVEDYLDFKVKELKPFFKNFNGTIVKQDRSWIISGLHDIDIKKGEIRITEIPPIMKYESFLNKLSVISENFNFKVLNNSSSTIDITLKFSDQTRFPELVAAIDKANKLMFSENIVVIKNSRVVEYERIEDYLDDFRLHRYDIRKRKFEQEIANFLYEDEFLRLKSEFIIFMTTKKRSLFEVDNWLDINASTHARKLESIRAKDLVNETINAIKLQLKDNEKNRKDVEKNLKTIEIEIGKQTASHISKAKITTNKYTEIETDEDSDIEKFNPADFLDSE